MAIADLESVGAKVRASLRVAVTIMALVLGLAACGSEATNETTPAADGSRERDGATVYADACASCHGADLGGTDKGPSMLSIVYEPNHHSDESFRRAIAVGSPEHHWTFGDMKPVEGLTAAEVTGVIEFVRSEQQRLGFEE